VFCKENFVASHFSKKSNHLFAFAIIHFCTQNLKQSIAECIFEAIQPVPPLLFFSLTYSKYLLFSLSRFSKHISHPATISHFSSKTPFVFVRKITLFIILSE
jgi:hypothetical protein